MKNSFHRFTRQLPDTKTIEFALIAAGVGVAITTVVDQVGGDLNALLASAVFGIN